MQAIMEMRQQVIEQNKALQSARSSSVGETPGEQKAAGFADALQDALETVNSTQARAAAMSEAYERGEVTDIASVMLARQEAGLAFEATLQTRNKLLSAYQEIMRMGV